MVAAITFLLTIRSKPKFAAGVIGVSVVALAISSRVTRHALPNIHGSSELIYMILKVPFNFAKNDLGLILWTDTLENLKDLTPRVVFAVPRWLPLGRIHKVGIVGFEFTHPLETLALALSLFGVAPSVAVMEIVHRVRAWRQRDRAVDPLPLWIRLTFVYGLVVAILGPALGAATTRLIGYGWPAFMIAVPAILAMDWRLDARTALVVAAAHLFACCHAGTGAAHRPAAGGDRAGDSGARRRHRRAAALCERALHRRLRRRSRYSFIRLKIGSGMFLMIVMIPHQNQGV
jgi:hypothetical protein